MYLRADKRDFNVGDVVTSAREFTVLNPQGSQDVEDVFERVRPLGKPKRIGNLYLFKDEISAKKHWSKMTDGKLYRATFDSKLPRHEGDMCLFNQAFELRTNIDEVEKLANRYWAGDLTEKPIIEVIVLQATISEVVSKDQQERRAYLASWGLVHHSLATSGSTAVQVQH